MKIQFFLAATFILLTNCIASPLINGLNDFVFNKRDAEDSRLLANSAVVKEALASAEITPKQDEAYILKLTFLAASDDRATNDALLLVFFEDSELDQEDIEGLTQEAKEEEEKVAKKWRMKGASGFVYYPRFAVQDEDELKAAGLQLQLINAEYDASTAHKESNCELKYIWKVNLMINEISGYNTDGIIFLLIPLQKNQADNFTAENIIVEFNKKLSHAYITDLKTTKESFKESSQFRGETFANELLESIKKKTKTVPV